MKDLSFCCIPSDGFQTLRNPGQLFTANILDSNQLAQPHHGTGEWKWWDFRSRLHAFGHSLCSIVFLHIDSFWPDVGFLGDSVVKNLLAKAGDTGDIGLIPGSGRSLGGGNGNALQYSCLGNPMDRGAWRATVHSVAKSRTWLKWLSAYTHTHTHTPNSYGSCGAKIKWVSICKALE